MIIYNKVILLSNLDELNELLNDNENPRLYNCKCIYENRIAIKHDSKKNVNTIRIWRTKSLFDYWYNDFNYSAKNFIAAFDYTIYHGYIKIDYIGMNDDEKKYMYHNSLDSYDAEKLINALIHFIKIVGIKEKKTKIIMDVHQNLRYYLKYYNKDFIITKRKSIDNPYWIEIEMNVS